MTTQTQQAGRMSRRSFFTGAVVAATGVACTAAFQPAFAAEAAASDAGADGDAETAVWKDVQLAKGHVVHDPSLCSGCRTCEIVCSTYHDGVASSEHSRIQWTKDLMKACQTDILTCKQCPGPECVAVCPTKACHIDAETGARVIDEDVCVGCQLCLNACPVEPSRIRYDAAKDACIKCDLCGGEPQCVKFCPMGALRASWEEVADTSAEDAFYEKNFTGDAAAFTHMETNTIVLTEVAGGIQFDAVLWTSHATNANIINVNFTVTVDALDASGNVIATSEQGSAAIPEMSSAKLSMLVPGVASVASIDHMVINVEGICERNVPIEEA